MAEADDRVEASDPLEPAADPDADRQEWPMLSGLDLDVCISDVPIAAAAPATDRAGQPSP